MKSLLLVLSSLIFLSIIFYPNINNSVGKKISKILIYYITEKLVKHQNNLNKNSIYFAKKIQLFIELKP